MTLPCMHTSHLYSLVIALSACDIGCDQHTKAKGTNCIYWSVESLCMYMLSIELVIVMSVRVQPHVYTSSHPGLARLLRIYNYTCA